RESHRYEFGFWKTKSGEISTSVLVFRNPMIFFPVSAIRTPASREPDIFPRIHLEIERERVRRVWLDHFFHEFHLDWILPINFVFIHRLEIDRDEKRPGHFRVDSLPALDAEHLG